MILFGLILLITGLGGDIDFLLARSTSWTFRVRGVYSMNKQQNIPEVP